MWAAERAVTVHATRGHRDKLRKRAGVEQRDAARSWTGCRAAGADAGICGCSPMSSRSCMLTASHRRAEDEDGSRKGGEGNDRGGRGAGSAGADATAARAAATSILCFRFFSRFRALRTASFSAALRSLKGRAARRCSSAAERRAATGPPAALRSRNAAKRERVGASLMPKGGCAPACAAVGCVAARAAPVRTGPVGCLCGFCAVSVRNGRSKMLSV